MPGRARKTKTDSNIQKLLMLVQEAIVSANEQMDEDPDLAEKYTEDEGGAGAFFAQVIADTLAQSGVTLADKVRTQDGDE